MFGQKDDQSNPDPMQAVNDGASQLLASDQNTPSDLNAATPVAASAATAPDVISPAGGFPSSPNERIAPGGEPATLPEPAINYTPDTTVDADDNTPADDTGMVSDSDVSDAELIDIKQKALSELIPLIDKLDQPPLEKFRTIMMMIQASDDQRLVEKAYESAHAIEDEEARAQALLDIVNEINYFTHQSQTTDKD